MNMRKYIAFILALVVVSIFLAACGVPRGYQSAEETDGAAVNLIGAAVNAPGIVQAAEPAIENTDTMDRTAVAATGDVQAIEAVVGATYYSDITVEVNRPVRINFKVDAADLNACNNEIVVPEWNISAPLTAGDNFVEFTPSETGTFTYSCWMNMLRANIIVISQGSGDIGARVPPEGAGGYAGCPMLGGGYGQGGCPMLDGASNTGHCGTRGRAWEE